MAQEIINVGLFPADGTGDPLRTAFDKVNDNFTELYAAVAQAASGNTSPGGSTLPSTSAVTSVAGKVGDVQLSTTDIIGSVTLTQVNNLIKLAVDTTYNDIVDGAPAVLDTFKEVAAAIQNNPGFMTDLYSQMGDKLSKATGGALQGALMLHADPTTSLQAATKQYVDMNVASLNVSSANLNSSLTARIDTKESITNVAAYVSALNANVAQLKTDTITSLNTKANAAAVQTWQTDAETQLAAIETTLATKADMSYVTTAVDALQQAVTAINLVNDSQVSILDLQGNLNIITDQIAVKADKTELQTMMAFINSQFAVVNDSITQILTTQQQLIADVATLRSDLNTKADASAVYSKVDIDAMWDFGDLPFIIEGDEDYGDLSLENMATEDFGLIRYAVSDSEDEGTVSTMTPVAP